MLLLILHEVALTSNWGIIQCAKSKASSENAPGLKTAIAGGVAGNKLAEFALEVTEELDPTLGLKLGTNNEPVELLCHYSWEELQALSKPQT